MIRHLSFVWLLLYSVHSAAVEITVKVGEHAPHTMTLVQLQSALPVKRENRSGGFIDKTDRKKPSSCELKGFMRDG